MPNFSCGGEDLIPSEPVRTTKRTNAKGQQVGGALPLPCTVCAELNAAAQQTVLFLLHPPPKIQNNIVPAIVGINTDRGCVNVIR